MRSTDSVVGILTILRVVRYGVRTRMRALSSKTSKPALRSTQTPIQWVLGLFPWLNRPGYEVNHWPATSAGVKDGWSYNRTSLYFKMYR